MSVFQDLYHSEINFAVSTAWDLGFDVKLGDEMNGYCAEANFRRFGQIEPWLIEQAINHFPNSEFTRLYKDCADLFSFADNPEEGSFSRAWSYPPSSIYLNKNET